MRICYYKSLDHSNVLSTQCSFASREGWVTWEQQFSLQQWDIPVYILLGIQKRKLQSTQSVIFYNHWQYWNFDQDKLFENLYAFFHFNYYKRLNFAPKKTSCVNIAGKLCNSGLNNLRCILWFLYSTCQENSRIFTITESVKSSSRLRCLQVDSNL